MDWPDFTVFCRANLPVASHYQGKTEFSCISDPSIKLDFSRVNDNTCDCPDGSDEPGTAACAYIDPLSPSQPLAGSKPALPGFWCENKGHIGAYVPFVYVNDGMCDYDLCCDGSEEYSRVKCPNRCVEIGKEHRRLAEEQNRKMERASGKREAMIKEGIELRRKAEARLAELNAEVDRLDASKQDLHKKYVTAQAENTGRVVKTEGAGGKLGVLVGVAKTRVTELRNTLDATVKQRTALRARMDELQTILSKLKEEYNPNFNDEGVKSAVKAFEDFAARETSGDDVPDSEVDQILQEDSETSGINWKEFEDDASDTDVCK